MALWEDMDLFDVPLSNVSTVTEVEASLTLTLTVSSEPKFSDNPSRLMVEVVIMEWRLGLSEPLMMEVGVRRFGGILGKGR